MERGEEEVRCIDMVFFQVVFVLKSSCKIENGEIIDAMRKLLGFKGLKMKDKQTIERTLDLWEKHQDDIVDCYVVARMEEEVASEIYSFDRKTDMLGVKRIDP